MVVSKKKRKLFIWSSIIIGFIGVILVLLSILTPKYIIEYIEENDVALCNRQITIQDISFNPLNFNFNVLGFKMTEPDSTSIFISFDTLFVNLEALPLFNSIINVEQATATNLYGHIIQNGKRFNFTDFFEGKKKSNSDEVSEPLEFNLKKLNIVKSRLHYSDTQVGSKIILDSISIFDESFSSIDTVFDAKVSIHQQQGGWVNGDVFYNFKDNDYALNAEIKEWQLSPFQNYVTSVIRLSKFDGQLSSEFKISGNVDSDIIKTSGQVTINDFNLIDPENNPLIKVGTFFMDIKEIDSQKNIYDFKNILVNDSNISFDYLPNGDNFTKWMVTSDAQFHKTATEENIPSEFYVSPFKMLSVYIYDMTKEYIFKSYTAEKILFSNFNLKFHDYTLEDPFFMDLENLEIKSENIKPKNQFANFHVNGKMNSTGIIDGDISVSRQGVENMTVDMGVKGLFLNRFSPYSREYTAHRFMEGISSFRNKSVIKDSYLTSTNTLHIEKVKVSKKHKTATGSSLPMRFAVALMKDSKGDIDLEIPIEGPINDPKYKFRKIVWQVVKNLFTKMVTSPVKALSNTLNVNEDDLKNVYFNNGQQGLGPFQKKSLDAIAIVLQKKPEFNITLNHLYNIEYEMDAFAVKSAKIAYLKQSGVSLDKNIPLGKHASYLSSTDSNFLEYLKKINPNFDETISIPENARRLLGEEAVKAQLILVIAKQKQLIKDYLVVEKSIPEIRFSIKDGATTEEAINQSKPKFEVKFGLD